jgi:hypothetical protein
VLSWEISLCSTVCSVDCAAVGYCSAVTCSAARGVRSFPGGRAGRCGSAAPVGVGNGLNGFFYL